MHLKQIASYWDSRAEGYSMTIHEQLCGEECGRFRDLLRGSAPEGAHLSCLDIGCGPGFFSILLARDGHEVTAVDYSEGMLRQARENFEEAGVRVTCMQADAQHLPFADAGFDYIVSRNLVWNLEQPEQAYQEWLRILKPGGRLLVADGNHYLYYYDKDYETVRAHTPDIHAHACHGVDPAPINEIARDLPLSHEHRPDWDMRTLSGMGLENICFRVSRCVYRDMQSAQEKSVVSDFVLWGEKPVRGARGQAARQREIDEHWTDSSDNYSRIVQGELSSFRAEGWTELILRSAPHKPVLDVLDAGCGPAFFSILLARAGHRVVGLDGSAGMLSHAAQNAAQYGVCPLFVKGDCQATAFADNSFDLVVSRNVTHALLDHRRAYAEWHRVLRPGGKLLIFDANWHLMQTDPDVRREFSAREQACFERYGSNFSAGKTEKEVEDSKTLHFHHLGACRRPDWDVPLLRGAGFREIHFERDITQGLWDDKEKLLYGATPMFMIAAEK